MWPKDQESRAPAMGDFPPRWASAWGDDRYGLWADLVVAEVVQRLRWIEPTGKEGFEIGAKQKERDKIRDENLRDWANNSETEPTVRFIHKGYWLADTPCTQAFWQAVVGGKNPSHFSEGKDAAQRPVEQVNLNDCEQFLKAVQALLPARISAALPNEVEWEYACRAGTQEAYWWGHDFDASKANAGGKIGGTTPVKTYAPNPWGLYDMHGNVWEWTTSVWSQRIDKPSQAADSAKRVVRGGSWDFDSDYARSAYREWWHPVRRYDNRGLRFVLRY